MKTSKGYQKINYPAEFLPAERTGWMMVPDGDQKYSDVPDYWDRFLIAMIVITGLFVIMILINTPLFEILTNDPVHEAGNIEVTEIINQ